jgi:hypothetical protein
MNFSKAANKIISFINCSPVVEDVVVASIAAVVEMKLLVEDKTDSKVLQRNLAVVLLLVVVEQNFENLVVEEQ